MATRAGYATQGSNPGLADFAARDHRGPTRHSAPDRTATHRCEPGLGQAHRERRPRREGHWAGVDAIRSLVDGVLGLEHVGTLTVYAMSIENLLRRPAAEVEWLLALFDRVVADEEAKLRARGVQLRFIGNLDLLPEPLRLRLLAAAARPPDGPQRLLLCIAVSYGGREEVAGSR